MWKNNQKIHLETPRRTKFFERFVQSDPTESQTEWSTIKGYKHLFDRSCGLFKKHRETSESGQEQVLKTNNSFNFALFKFLQKIVRNCDQNVIEFPFDLWTLMMPKICEIFEGNGGVKIFGKHVDFDKDKELMNGSRNELEYEHYEVMNELMKLIEILVETDEGIKLLFHDYWYASQLFFASEFKPQICLIKLDNYENDLKNKNKEMDLVDKMDQENNDEIKKQKDWFTELGPDETARTWVKKSGPFLLTFINKILPNMNDCREFREKVGKIIFLITRRFSNLFHVFIQFYLVCWLIIPNPNPLGP